MGGEELLHEELAAARSHARFLEQRLEALLGRRPRTPPLPEPPSAPPPPAVAAPPPFDDALPDFASVVRLVLALTVPLLLLLLVESATAQWVLGVPSLHARLGGGGPPGAPPPPPAPLYPAAPPDGPLFSTPAAPLPLRADTLGGLLVAHRNPRAVVRVLRQFRAAYPEGDLVVLCDDGCYNYSALCARFGAHWEGFARPLTTKTDPGFYLRAPQQHELIDALRATLPRVRSRFLMLLETDVLIEDRLPGPFNFTLNGGVAPPKGWMVGGEVEFARKLNPAFNTSLWRDKPPYGGQGGSVLNTRFIEAVATQPTEQLERDLAVFAGCSTTVGVDYFFSALVYRYGGTLGGYDGYLNWPGEQPFTGDRVRVLHPDKSDYGAPLEDEDLRDLGPEFETVLKARANSRRPRVPNTCDRQPEDAGKYRWGGDGLAEDARARGAPWPP
jgi:hypothetical protein